MMKIAPKVSVCIPVYLTEGILFRCLESIKNQSAQNIEVIVVDDASPGKDEHGHNTKKIVKAFSKLCKKERPDITVKYLSHNTNLGLVEARRTAILEATSPFVYILDSDDDLLPNCLEDLLAAQEEHDADIVQGLAVVMRDGKAVDDFKGVNHFVDGTLEGRDILYQSLVKRSFSRYLIGKLFRTSIYRQAFDYIPHIECTMNEEIIQSFFLCLFSKKYVGVAKPVFHYNTDAGITSRTIITDLDRWNKACSASSVFTSLLTYMEEHQEDFKDEEIYAMQLSCRNTLKNRLLHLEKGVAPEIRDEAYKMLCDWWGESFVKNIEAERKQSD